MSAPPPPQGLSGFDASRMPQRLDLEIQPEIYAQIEEISIRSGRSIPEIIQELISRSLPDPPLIDS